LGAKVSESLKKNIIDKLFDMPINYITLSPVLSVCNSCKTKVVGEHYVCPNCKDADHMMVYSRIIGYVRPIISGHICIENNMINGDENYWQDARRVDWVDRNKL
jgi:ribonucleoside-triphosphate reductase